MSNTEALTPGQLALLLRFVEDGLVMFLERPDGYESDLEALHRAGFLLDKGKAPHVPSRQAFVLLATLDALVGDHKPSTPQTPTPKVEDSVVEVGE